MGSSAHLHHIGVADNNLHAIEGHVEEVGDDLGKTRFVALAARLRADDDVHASLRLHRDPRLLIGCAD